MRVAIIGASSRIGQDLVQWALIQKLDLGFDLYSSREPRIPGGGRSVNRPAGYRNFTSDKKYDLVINCVGRGSPKKLEVETREFERASIYFDELCLNYLENHNSTKYIFLSSGAVYSNFDDQRGANDMQPINADFENPYANTKRLIEARHRELSHLAIYDIRVFGYVSKSLKLNEGTFLSDILSDLVGDKQFTTDNQDFFRDYCSVSDFANLLSCIIASPRENAAYDLYSQKPVAKFELLRGLELNFGLRYSISSTDFNKNISPTGQKRNYFSSSRNAEALGYVPKMTSLESCLGAFQHLLDLHRPAN